MQKNVSLICNNKYVIELGMSGGRFMAQCQFVEGYRDFPVCNHIQEIGTENIGYQTGMFDDGLPFEVEEYEYGEGDSKVRELAIIMPDIGVEEDDCENAEYDFDYTDAEDDEYDLDYNAYDRSSEKSNIEMFQYKMELKDYSALPIGMVLRGQEDSFPIIKWYQEFIEEMGIVEYVSDIRTASVFYYTDVNGNDLVQVRTGLITNGQEEAISHVELRNFPNRKLSTKRNKQILRLVK